MTRDRDVVVVGGGSFGTALGAVLAAQGRPVDLVVRRAEQASEINERHTNHAYFGDTELPAALRATVQLEDAVRRARAVLLVVPSRAVREVCGGLSGAIEGDQYVVHAIKGLEASSGKRMSQIVREETCALKVGALSGPNLARELLAQKPTGALVASAFDEVALHFQALFAGTWFRLYRGRDMVGTELAGAFKNVIAIAAGFATGLELGDNAKALLISRGLREMTALGTAMGASADTFAGLAGVGDLIATCASPLSRNHQVGVHLSRGEPLEAVLERMGQVAEGVPTASAVYRYATARSLGLPIVTAVYRVVHEGLAVPDALRELMALPVGDERDLPAMP